MEAQLFAYSQMRGLQLIRSGDLLQPLRISKKQERELLDRLNRAGLIAQVQRGLYLIPPRLPLGGKWSPDEALALKALITAQGGAYQICGPSAFNFHGFDDQIPNRISVYNNMFSGTKQIGAITLSLVKVAADRLGSTTSIQSSGGETATYASRARTLVDAVYDWSRFGSLPRGYAWLRNDIRSGNTTAEELVQLTLRYGDVGTKRRIGFLLEKEEIGLDAVRTLYAALPPTKSTIPWIPGRPKRGKTFRQWGIIDNSE